MMDFEKLAREVEKLEKHAGAIAPVGQQKIEELDPKALNACRESMRTFMQTSRDALMMLLKGRKEPIRVGHLFRDAAAKSLIPGDEADRGDALLIRWGGQVTPTEPRSVHDDAVKLSALASKLIPVLKAYKKEEPNPR